LVGQFLSVTFTPVLYIKKNLRLVKSRKSGQGSKERKRKRNWRLPVPFSYCKNWLDSDIIKI